MRTVNRFPSAPCSGDGYTAPFGHHRRFRRFIARFTFVRLRKSHVTVVFLPFPGSLTTSFIGKKRHRAVWPVLLQALAGGPSSIQSGVQNVMLLFFLHQ